MTSTAESSLQDEPLPTPIAEPAQGSYGHRDIPTGFVTRSITFEDESGHKEWTHHPSLPMFGGWMSACTCRRCDHPGVPCSINELIDGARYLNKYVAMFQQGEGVYLLAAAAYTWYQKRQGLVVGNPNHYFAKICSKERWLKTKKMLIRRGLHTLYKVVKEELVHDFRAETKFLAKVKWQDGPVCSVWTKGLDRDGYPRHYVGNKEVRAHRWYFAEVLLPAAQAHFWETGDLGAFAADIGLKDDVDLARMLIAEPLPADWDIDHTCGNRACMTHIRPMPKEINRSKVRNPSAAEVERQAEMNRVIALASRTNWETLACCAPLCSGEVVGLIFRKSGGKMTRPICQQHYRQLTDRHDTDGYVFVERDRGRLFIDCAPGAGRQ